MKHILITGANSYLGTAFERHIAALPGYTVDTLDMLGDAWRTHDFSRYTTVLHVAGIAHVDTKKPSPALTALYYRVNTDLAVETAKKAKMAGVGQFLYMSSVIVYGDSAPPGHRKMITHDTVPQPTGAYGDSKLKAEQALTALADDHFKVALLRPPMIYGKNSRGNYPVLAKLAQRLPFFPETGNQRSLLYIDNFCAFVQAYIDKETSGILFPQNGEYASTGQLVRLIAQAHGRTMHLTRWLNAPLRLLGRMPLVRKAFGSLTVDRELTQDIGSLASLAESIQRIEG